mgnify:CR=1 FL=1
MQRRHDALNIPIEVLRSFVAIQESGSFTKAADLLRLIPETDVAVIERCSGHGGAWGVHKENFETALKVGKPVARQAASNGKAHLSSECPLAATHILQGLERIEGATVPAVAPHPVVLLARAYGFTD